MENLKGLIFCGGKRSRMGVDKSLLEYHGMPHRNFLFNLLQEFCESVYLSVNTLQARNTDDTYPYIEDAAEYNNIGPMSALLSAWGKFPDSSWLVLGCDYPFVSKENLASLIQHRDGRATCFIHPEKEIHEPLLTIYENSFYPVILENYYKQNFSMSKILKSENAAIVKPSSEFFLQNVNTMEEYYSAKKLINSQQPN